MDILILFLPFIIAFCIVVYTQYHPTTKEVDPEIRENPWPWRF